MAAATTRYARSGDVHLAYQAIGDGPRDLVLSLDWASHLEVLWEQPFVQELVSSLARFSRVSGSICAASASPTAGWRRPARPKTGSTTWRR